MKPACYSQKWVLVCYYNHSLFYYTPMKTPIIKLRSILSFPEPYFSPSGASLSGCTCRSSPCVDLCWAPAGLTFSLNSSTLNRPEELRNACVLGHTGRSALAKLFVCVTMCECVCYITAAYQRLVPAAPGGVCRCGGRSRYRARRGSIAAVARALSCRCPPSHRPPPCQSCSYPPPGTLRCFCCCCAGSTPTSVPGAGACGFPAPSRRFPAAAYWGSSPPSCLFPGRRAERPAPARTPAGPGKTKCRRPRSCFRPLRLEGSLIILYPSPQASHLPFVFGKTL